MSQQTVEERLTALEQKMARVESVLPAAPPAQTKWWELPGPPPSPELLEAMKEAEAYGRYFRVTGREAPPDWKPGDPIPEPINLNGV
jgi:hypothetical protein